MADHEGYVPVYLPDRTVIGKAYITEDMRGSIMQIELPPDSAVAKLFQEDLMGLSIVYQRKEAQEIVDQFNEREKKTDE